MLTVHAPTATTFTATGRGVLDPEVIEAKVREELGGAYQLTLTYPADGPLASLLVVEAIIAAPVPGFSARQGFRIREVTTSLDGLLEVSAFHVFYDLAGNFIADTYVVGKTPKAALDQLLGAATTPHRFTATSSDTTTRASARVVRMNLATALIDAEQDNSFVSRWAGELTRDNWHIHHSPRRGANRGVVIRDRKNLTGYTSSVDLTSVVTRIVPVGFDGITLPELYVDSPHVDHYAIPHIKVMRYPDIKAISDPANPREGEVPLAQAHALLRQAAKAEFTHNHLDTPAASYTVSFVDLVSTTEYVDLAELETVALGDTVTVQHADLGVSLSARVVGYEYDPLRGAYVSVELGSVAGTFTSITRQITTAQVAAEKAADMAGVALASADGKNTNHYGPTKPATARLGDTWFKTNGENVEIWIYQANTSGQPTWVALATDLNHAQVSAELATVKTHVEEAQVAAENASDAAREAVAKVDTFNGELTQAKTRADTAYTTAMETKDSTRAWFTQLSDAERKLSSSLSVLAGDVNLRVKSGEVISQINLSPETVLIDAKRIHISGATSIDNATITTAMIKDAAITNAKIASLDASKITTGTLSAARIGARSITADKLAANAIQVGLAGWNQSIRISPTRISWYDGSNLEGTITSNGMNFWYGTRFVGAMARRQKKNEHDVQGIVNQLAHRGDYVAWSYQKAEGGDYYTCLTLDPKGRFYDRAGIHLGADLRMNGYNLYTSDSRYISFTDTNYTGAGTFASISSSNGLAKIGFHTYDVLITTNGAYYNMSRIVDRLQDLMVRVNELIRRLNYGWIVSISQSGSSITWTNFNNAGLSAMSTTLA